MISLKVDGLTKQYNQPLLEKVEFSFSGKGVVGFIGDNGSGKSSFLRILSGEDQSFMGRFVWSGEPSIGYMPQEIMGRDYLSGGQKKMEKLASLIYGESHDVLLLDEPDNHLDFEGKEWLSEALEGFGGLVVMISHDRDFLEQNTSFIWLIEDRKIRTFPYGYEKFSKTDYLEKNYLEKLYRRQVKEKKRLEVLVKEFGKVASYNSKRAAAYRSMQKRLNRHTENMVQDPGRLKGSISLNSKLSKKKMKRKTAIFVKDLEFGYGDELVFSQANLHLEVGEKVALVSPNGSGKSTLIKLLLGELKADAGFARIGVNLDHGYYSQEHAESLDQTQTPIKVLMDEHPLFEYQAKEILKKFLFSEQTTKSRIDTLSGGQKSRLQLALFLYKSPDVLLLDEPTNHLDIKSILALENFLCEYKGTVLLISHDKRLIKNVCEKIYLMEDGKIISGDMKLMENT